MGRSNTPAARVMTGGHRFCSGICRTPGAGLREMIDRGIGRFGSAQRFCQDGLLIGHRASCLDRHANWLTRAGFFQPITGWRFSAAAAVQPKPTFQLRDPVHSAPLSRLATRRSVPVVPTTHFDALVLSRYRTGFFVRIRRRRRHGELDLCPESTRPRRSIDPTPGQLLKL